MTQLKTDILKAASATNEVCACDQPVPVQYAEHKGAAMTICQRCGLRVRLAFR